ncbi:hypothetical protein NDA18_005200 [Ustilago nuda]|nr:hypothetical protein NDA18_005200 [Ustilago nuda]
MRTLYFFVMAYFLMAAVACQPLREAKAELEVSRKAYRKPRQPPKLSRPATPKVKSRITIVSEFLSHFTNRGRAASVAAQTDIKPLEFTAYTQFQQSPTAKFDGIANPARPESLFKPRNKPFRFCGEEGGYVADTDHARHNAKLYDRPPLSTKLGIGADASGARVEEDRLHLSAEGKAISEAERHTAIKRAVIMSVVLTIMSGLILWSGNRIANAIDANNQAMARASESQQAAMQQAAAESTALWASGSGGSKIQLRSLSSGDVVAHDVSVRTSQPKDDRSLPKQSVVPIIKSEKAADKEDLSKTLTKRFNPLEIIENALQKYTQDSRRLVGPVVACFMSILGLIGAVFYYETKSQKPGKDHYGNNTERAEPKPSPAALRLKDVDNRDDSAFIQTSNDEKLHHTELRKRWNPVAAMIDCWHGRVEDSGRVAVAVMENAPSGPRLLLVKLFTGAAALLGVSGAVVWYGYRRQSDSTPEPQESKQPEKAPVPAPNRQHFAEVRHTMLKKRSLGVDPAAHLDLLSVEQSRPALLKRDVTNEKIKRLLVQGDPGVTQIPLHKREVLQAQGATNSPTRSSLRRGDEHLEDLPLKDGHLVKRAIGAMEVEGPTDEALRLLDGTEREMESLRFRNELQRRRRREAFRKALRTKRILGGGIFATLSLASLATLHQKLDAARKREQAAKRKARGATNYPVRVTPHKRDMSPLAVGRFRGEGARLLDHPAAAEFPGFDVAVRRRPAFRPRYRNIVIGTAITLAAAIQGTFLWLAFRALKKQTPSQIAAKQQAEEERLQAGFKRSRRPGQLSKRMISRAAISLMVQDFKSLANKAPLTPAEKLARAKRLRKYARVGAGLAAVKGVESIVVYEVLKSYKENKRIKQQLQEIKQQQQQQASGYVGNSYYAPSHILSKRAKVQPVSPENLEEAVEYGGNPPYELWKWKTIDRVKKVGMAVGATLIILGSVFGLNSAWNKLTSKKNGQNNHSVFYPFQNRDLSSQAQKEESHELAKREPARDGLVEAAPSHILSKRAKVQPVSPENLEEAVEYGGNPPYELWKWKTIDRVKKVGMAVGATLIILGSVFGLNSAWNKLTSKKNGQNNHSVFYPFQNRDLSSQAQKEESHELAKREPARDGLVEAAPSHILSKRAKVQPVSPENLEEAVEYGGNPPYELWKWKTIDRVKKVGMAVGATLIILGSVFGLNSAWNKLTSKKNGQNNHSVFYPFQNRDLSSQAQKEESHELAKREPARDGLVEAAPSHILSKRAKVQPVSPENLEEAVEYGGNPPYELWKWKTIDRVKKVGMAVGATLIILGSVFGLNSAWNKLTSKKNGQNNHSVFYPFQNRDLSSQAQKEESHELAKREPARDGLVEAAPSDILSKRAIIRPVGAAEITVAEEHAGNPPYEAWKQRMIYRLKMAGYIVTAFVSAVAAAFGLRYIARKLEGNKENPNDGAVVDPFHKRDLSSQTQKDESHELAKREPARDGLVEADIPKTAQVNWLKLEKTKSAVDLVTERSEGRNSLRKRSMPPASDGVPAGAALVRILRQVAIGSRQKGLINPDPHQLQSSSDDSKSPNKHTASAVPLFLIAEVAKSSAWREKIRKLQQKYAEDADDDKRQEYHSSHHGSLMKRMEQSCLSGVFLATLAAMNGHKAKNDVDQHAPSNAVAGQKGEQQRTLAKRFTTNYSKLTVSIFSTFIILEGLGATLAIKEHSQGNKPDRSRYYSTYPAPRPRYENTPRSAYTQSF